MRAPQQRAQFPKMRRVRAGRTMHRSTARTRPSRALCEARPYTDIVFLTLLLERPGFLERRHSSRAGKFSGAKKKRKAHPIASARKSRGRERVQLAGACEGSEQSERPEARRLTARDRPSLVTAAGTAWAGARAWRTTFLPAQLSRFTGPAPRASRPASCRRVPRPNSASMARGTRYNAPRLARRAQRTARAARHARDAAFKPTNLFVRPVKAALTPGRRAGA